MEEILTSQGHTLVDNPSEADVVIVNTCSFIAAARAETAAVLQELGRQKQPGQRLLAVGCMAASHPDLLRTLPEIDGTLSTHHWPQIGALVAPPAEPGAETYTDWRMAPFRRQKQGPSAFLKISDGCNLQCAFCTIPHFKGPLNSKPPATIVQEAQELVAQGVQELILVAQHLTAYGQDLGLQDGLACLLDLLCTSLPTDVWLRLMYAYPQTITPRLITTMAHYPQICAYLDLPLQHAHPETLQRMNRPSNIAQTKEIIATLRASIPNLTLRSTFIVGFPGETRTEFQTLLAFLSELKLDRVGVFRYSNEPGTPAAKLPHQVSPKIIERRWQQAMQLQQAISLRRNEEWQGRSLLVLVEGQGTTDDGQPLSVGRSFRDAPEVDGQVFIWGQAPLGKRVEVQITHATEYDLWGRISPPSSAL